MANLSNELVQEFRTIFREEYGFEMPGQDAARAAVWLMTFFDVLAETATKHGTRK